MAKNSSERVLLSNHATRVARADPDWDREYDFVLNDSTVFVCKAVTKGVWSALRLMPFGRLAIIGSSVDRQLEADTAALVEDLDDIGRDFGIVIANEKGRRRREQPTE